MALFKKKKQKIWIFKVYDRHGKRGMDWECGDRSFALFKQLFDGFRTWKIIVGMTRAVFIQVSRASTSFKEKRTRFPLRKRIVATDKGLLAFEAKPLAHLRPLEMIDITMRIFPAIHVNTTLQFGWSIFDSNSLRFLNYRLSSSILFIFIDVFSIIS